MPANYFIIDSPSSLDLKKIEKLLTSNQKLKLSDAAIRQIKEGRKYLDDKIKKSKSPIYGINTGFGSLCNVKINDKELEKLQENLVKSHACGTGEEVPSDIVRLMLLLKIQGLSQGNSGICLETVERLIFFYNHHIFPIVYKQGSLGASGDLAPLSHLSLPLLGMGEVFYNGIRQSTEKVYHELKLKPLRLKSKEGLALLNGTQFMSAYGVSILLKTRNLFHWADFAGAVSIDAFDGRIEPFSKNIQNIRPHAGQKQVASNVRKWLEGSEIIKQKKEQVQDPYAFRCIPQVHGASYDAFLYAEKVIVTEINSVTDNPTLFPESDEIISGGNFHGQPLALALDFLCIAIAEIGSISERRIFQLISGQRNLPPFLAKNAGINSGFMIPQYTAASIASQNKQLCTPASVDSIVSSNGQEDHVSMGANAATKCYQVLENTERIISIELFNAFQALDFRKPLKSSPSVEKIKKNFRSIVPFIDEDKIMYQEMEAALQFLKNNYRAVFS
jgi:histidine ammonia-lyase